MNGPGLPHRAYRGWLRLLALPLLAWLWWRGRREPGYRLRWRERLGFIDPAPAAIGGLWLHAASVGEVQAAQALLQALQPLWPNGALTVSTQTPTGADALHARWGQALPHHYAPLDTPGAVSRFLDRLQPRLLVLMERELWPELLWQCEQRAIPVAVVNARLTERTARQYRRWQRIMTPRLQGLALVACDDPDSARRFVQAGARSERTHTCGQLKFDIPAPPPWDVVPAGLAGRTLWVAGSTHADDEARLLPVWAAFSQRHPEALLVLAPRHPQRFDAVAAALGRTGLRSVRRSQGQPPQADTQVLLLDTLGELSRWYPLAHGALMGGTWAEVGGHNALEALAGGCPVLFGPHTHQFEALFDGIAQAGAGEPVEASGLAAALEHGTQDMAAHARRRAAALAFVHTHQGAAARTLAALRTHTPACPANPLQPVARHHSGASTCWFDPQRRATVTDANFAPPPAGTTSPGHTALATGSGRGQVHVLPDANGPLLLRHYRRGGLVAKLVHDRFRYTGVAHSRAMREYTLLRQMCAEGLPVPTPVAARCQRHGWGHSADILVGLLPHSRNVAQCLDTARLPPAAWAALGLAIARLHAAGVHHADLNCHNLLLDAHGQAWIVDFDKCERRPGTVWQAGNLTRLLRSLRKEAQRRHPFHWHEADWAVLLDAYRAHHSTRP